MDFKIEQSSFRDDRKRINSFGMRRILESSLEKGQLGDYSASTDDFSFTENGSWIIKLYYIYIEIL